MNHLDAKHNSGLHHACDAGDEIVVAYLLSKIDPGKQNLSNRDTPLHIACRRGHKSVIQNFFLRGVAPKTKNEDGLLPLEVACKNGHLQIALNIATTQHNNACLPVTTDNNGRSI